MSAVRSTVNQPQVLANPATLAHVVMPACTQHCSVQLVVQAPVDLVGNFAGSSSAAAGPVATMSPGASAMTRPNTRGVSVRAPSTLRTAEPSQRSGAPREEGPMQRTAPRATNGGEGCTPFAFWAAGTESCIEGGVGGAAAGALAALVFPPAEVPAIAVGAAFGCIADGAGTLVRKAAMCLTE